MGKWYLDVTKAYKPTEDDLKRNRTYISECKRLEINVSTFASSDEKELTYTREELRALSYLAKGQKVPSDLEKYLLETKSDREAKWFIGDSKSFDVDQMDIEYNKIYDYDRAVSII